MLVVTDSEDVNVELSNIRGIQVTSYSRLNVLDITSADSVIITESVCEKLRRCSDNGSKEMFLSAP